MALGSYLFGEGGAWSHLPEGLVSSILYGMQTITLLVPLYLFTRIKYKSEPKDFGLRPVKIKPLLKYVALAYLIYYVASAIFVQLQVSYDVEIPGYGEQETHVPLFGDTVEGLIVGALIIVLVAPLIEELFFRGYLYQVFRKYSPKVWWASVGSAAIFALFHLEFQVFIPIFILGLVMNWSFEKTGSLWTPIIFHMTNNALAFLLEIAVFYEWIEVPF